MSVTTFEDHTKDLTEEEISYVPIVVKALKTIEKPMTSENVCNLIQMFYFKENESHLPFTGARLRKFVNHIRSHSLLPVIATSQGYSVSYEREVILKQIQSLNERSSSIKKCADGLKSFLQ